MSKTTTEENPSYILRWSLTPSPSGSGGDERLVLRYSVQAFEELYVSDRLWDHRRKVGQVPDPFGVYRFVVGDTLRLVFEQAPHPPNIVPNNVFPPRFSRVAAGETLERSVDIALPVEEYSALARDVSEPSEVEQVEQVELVLGYCLRSELDADPVPPPNQSAEQAGYLLPKAPKRIVSRCKLETPIAVKHRSGYMARYPLHGEPAPGPAPLP